MISILIPIYNQDVTKLVRELADQCNRAGLGFEILAFDDASREKYRKVNREIEQLFGVNYVESERNLGRSAMRNRLARTASMEYLLFLDCDVKIPSRQFIKRYAEAMAGGYAVVNGGIVYARRAPGRARRLHWEYGRRREALPAARRRRSRFGHLMTGNLLIWRDLFLRLPLDERLSGYGHEDSLLGKILRDESVSIHQIDNPVQHMGLDKSDVFLKKQAEALHNLRAIRQRDPLFSTRLTRVYDRLASVAPGRWWLGRLSARKDRLVERLRGASPRVRDLDLYKLALWYELQRATPAFEQEIRK